VRFNHPLFGEVIRRKLGMAAARRLRGEVVRALQERPLRGAADRIRLAELTLDSDQPPDVELLVAAARDAIALTNVTLGERLARAAVNRGGGLVASELLARSSEETLSSFAPDRMNEIDLVRWGTARVANLHWSMGDAESADEVLELLRTRLTDHRLKLVIDGLAVGVYAAAQQFEQIGALLSAADAAAQAAVAFDGANDRRRSVEAAASANRLAAECGGIRTPALDLASHPLPLTVREREIANLVAAGRLVVSVRTVEGHLYRPCIKLDISEREELAALIRRSGLARAGLTTATVAGRATVTSRG
jgi:DNA-binding CsgD family transcriptional regulator